MNEAAPRAGIDLGRARLALCTLTAVCSLPGLFGGFVWDDNLLLVRHPLIQGAVPPWRAWLAPLIESDPAGHVYYRPVVSFAFAVWARVWGPSPLAFHVLSWLLYLGVVWASVGWLARRTQSGRRANSGTRVGWPVLVAAAWLALHPTRAQSVAWVSGAFDLWMALFALAAARCVEPAQPRARHLIGAALASALALWSKEAGVVVPVWLATDVTLRYGAKGARARRGPLLACLAGTCLALWTRSAFTTAPESTPWDEGVAGLLSRALVSLGFLVGRALWPFDLTVQRELALSDFGALPLRFAALGLLGLVALLATLALALRSRRAPALTPWLTDALGFLILVAPTLNVIVIGQQGGSLSERYLLLPLLPLGSLLARALERVPRERTGLAWLASGALALAFVLQYQVEQGRFRSERSFFDSLLDDSPSSLFAYDYALSLAIEAGAYPRARALASRRARLALERPEGYSAWLQRRPAPDASERAIALLRFAHAENTLVSDANQPRLVELRDYVDGVLEPQGRTGLEVAGERYAVTPSPAVIEKLEAEGLWEDARLLRITLHARTLQLARAAAWLQQPWPEHEAGRARLRLRARFALWTSDLERAQRFAQGVGPRLVRGYAVLARDLARARAAGDSLAEARVVAGAGLPARARALAHAAEAPAALLAEIDLFDGRPDLALRKLSRAPPGPRVARLKTRAERVLQSGKWLRH